MVRIRLRRVGAKKQASYRIVVIRSGASTTGRPIETIGHFNPRTEPETFLIKEDRALYWLSVGAQPSDAVLRLLKKGGIMEKFAKQKAGEPIGSDEEESAPVEESIPAADQLLEEEE
jgi:small subunit ribosomal protein S16